MLREVERKQAFIVSLHNISYQTLDKLRRKCPWTH